MDQPTPPPPPPSLPPGPVYYLPPSRPVNGFAIASLTLGVMVFCCLNCATAIPGIIFGHIALWQTGRPGARTGGRGVAIAGLVLGYIGLVLCLVFATLYLLAVIVAICSGHHSHHMHWEVR